MGRDKEKRLEELVDEVDGPERQVQTETTTTSSESEQADFDSTPDITGWLERKRRGEGKFPTDPIINTREEYLVAGLVSLLSSFLTFVVLTYILLVWVPGYQSVDFFNSTLLSIVAFLYTFKYIAYGTVL